MGIKRMDNVLIVVEDMDAVKSFFVELGMIVDAETSVEGEWVDKVIGLTGTRSDIVVLKTPDGHSKVELSKFRSPEPVSIGQADAPANTLGVRRIMFTVDDVKADVERLREKHGAELIGEIADFQGVYRLCYLKGPEGIVLGLAQEL